MPFKSTSQTLQLLRKYELVLRKNFSSLSQTSSVSWESAKPFEKIPGFRSLPIVGTGWVYLPVIGMYNIQRQHLSNADRKRRFGDVYKESFGSLNVVISTRAEDMETIARNEGKYPKRFMLKSLKKYREMNIDKYKSLGIFLLDGPEWWELRQKIQKHMLPPTVAMGYVDAAQQVAADFAARVRRLQDDKGEVDDFKGELFKWAFESIAYVGLESRMGCLDQDPHPDGVRMIKAINDQFDNMFELDAKPFKKYNKALWNKFVQANDIFAEIAFKHIHRAVEDLKTGKVKMGEQPTVLQALLLKENMDPSEVVTFLSDMLFAGVETTSYTVAFFLQNMARFPEKQELLHQEIKKFLPNENSKMTQEIYPDMKYMRASLKESMRFSPTIPGSGRVLENDSVIGGYRVPAGTFIISGFLPILHDERYFEKPDEFLPERWLNRDFKNFNPFAFVPFGYGTRGCIAKRIAEMEISCFMAEILRNFKVEYHHEEIGLYTKFIFTPDKPLRFSFVRR